MYNKSNNKNLIFKRKKKTVSVTKLYNPVRKAFVISTLKVLSIFPMLQSGAK